MSEKRSPDDALTAYHFVALRAVPHVHLGAFVNVGFVLHARTAEFLGMRAITDAAALRSLLPDTDTELLARYLRCFERICEGGAEAGPIALAPPSERFHWLSAPRSDVLQASPVHMGLCEDPVQTLAQLFDDIAGQGR
ncbi:MAG: DUF3037 domain-containing protein [Gemmatimonadota bacterium]